MTALGNEWLWKVCARFRSLRQPGESPCLRGVSSRKNRSAGAVPTKQPPHRVLAASGFGITDRGRVRPNNEDRFLIAALAKALQVRQTTGEQRRVHFGSEGAHLFVVADGLGGNQGGEHASALAVNSIKAFVLNALKRFHGPKAIDLLRELREAISQAHANIRAHARRHPHLHGMGTTVTMACQFDSSLFVAHVGDSRGYLLRGGRLHRLTRDHTLVERMVRRGSLDPAKAAHHYLRNVVTNTVGGRRGVKVELHRLELQAGDVLLLCSDGLTNLVSDEEITRVLRSAAPPVACAQLVAQANENGGKDNITVIVVAFDDRGYE